MVVRSINNSNYYRQQFYIICGCLLVVLLIFLTLFCDKTPKEHFDIVIGFGLLCFFVTCFFAVKQFNLRKIVISNQGVLIVYLFRKNFIKWDEIFEVDYLGQLELSSTPVTSIYLKNKNKSLDVKFSQFSNGNILNQAIQFGFDSYRENKIVDLLNFTPIDNKVSLKCKNQNQKFQYVYSSPLINFRFYFLFIGTVSLVNIIYNIMYASLFPAMLGLPIVFLIFIIGFTGVHKVGVSNKYLSIEHYYLASEIVFDISKTKTVVFENKGANKPNSIRIITSDYTHKMFYLSNYTKKDWLIIEELLSNKGVEVDNQLHTQMSKNKTLLKNHA